MNKKLLWISRHEMTPDQKTDLERIMGGAVEITPWRDTVQDFTPLKPLVRESDAVAAVLPIEKMSQLLKLTQGKPVLQAVSARRPTGQFVRNPNGALEPEFRFIHQYWQQVIRMDVILRRL